MVLWQLLFLLIVSASFGHCYWPSSCRVSKGCYVWRLSELAKVRSPALCSTFSLPTTFGSLAPSFRSLISFSENLVFQDFKIAPHGSRDWLFGSKLQAGSLCTVLWVDSVSEWSKTPAWEKRGGKEKKYSICDSFLQNSLLRFKDHLVYVPALQQGACCWLIQVFNNGVILSEKAALLHLRPASSPWHLVSFVIVNICNQG